MIETLDRYTNFLWERFMADMNVFSSPWLYIPLLIPFIFYMIFFALKWYILLFPLTLPLSILRGWFSFIIERKKTEVTTARILYMMKTDMEELHDNEDSIEDLVVYWKSKYVITEKKPNV